MKKLLAMLCALCLLLSAFALAEEDTIVFGGTEPTYLEPNAPAIGGPEIHAVEQIQEGLVRMSSDGVTVEPLLATDWTISDSSVASLADGTATGVTEGEVTIIAKYKPEGSSEELSASK